MGFKKLRMKLTGCWVTGGFTGVLGCPKSLKELRVGACLP